MKIGPIEIKWVGFRLWRRDARRWLQQFDRELPPPAQPWETPDRAVRVKILAIKKMRETYDCGLKEAKERVESVMEKKE